MAKSFTIRIIRTPDFPWKWLTDTMSQKGLDALEEARLETQRFIGDRVVKLIRRRIEENKFDTPRARRVSPLTKAILEGRKVVSGPRDIHYPRSKNLPESPLLRNRDLIDSFKVLNFPKGLAVGIHGNRKAINGFPMADIARMHEEGYTIVVTEDMRKFFSLLLKTLNSQSRLFNRNTLNRKRLNISRSVRDARRGAAVQLAGLLKNKKIGDRIEVPARPMLAPIAELFQRKNPSAARAFEDAVLRNYAENVANRIPAWKKALGPLLNR